METIAWAGVVRTAVSVVGLGVALAALSFASWRASFRGESVRRELGGPGFLLPAAAGLLLVTLSLIWGAAALGERVLWTASSVLLTWLVVALLRRERARG